MRDHLLRSVSRATIGLLIAIQVTLASPVAPGRGPQPVLAADLGYAVDLATKEDFVAQKNLVQCVGASMQMMLNIIGPTADRTAGTQLRLQKLLRPDQHDFEPKLPPGKKSTGDDLRRCMIATHGVKCDEQAQALSSSATTIIVSLSSSKGARPL